MPSAGTSTTVTGTTGVLIHSASTPNSPLDTATPQRYKPSVIILERFSMGVLLALIIWIIVFAIVVYYVIPLFPPPIHNVARAIVGIIALLVCLSLLFGVPGLPVINWR